MLTALLHVDLSHGMCLYQVIMTLHVLNDIVSDVELTRKYIYVVLGSLKSEPTCKLINRIPGSRLSISSLPGSTLRTQVESLDKPRDINKHSQSLAW